VIKVTGTGFGNSAALVKFYCNGVWAQLTGSVTDTAVSVIAPANATSGNTRLVMGTDSVSGPLFTFTTITKLIPNTGLDGIIDTIAGTGFSPVLSQNNVTYKGIPATVISGNTGQLVVRVPKGASGYSLVSVAINGSSTITPNNIAIFKDTSLMVTLLGYVHVQNSYDTVPITAGPVGAFVQIHGYGFNLLANHTQVSFNGTPASVISGGVDTVLFAKVPPGATSGPITVTSNGQTVTGPSYTVMATGVATFAGNYNTLFGAHDLKGPFTDGAYVPLGGPTGLAYDNQQNLYVLDYANKVNILYELSADGNSATTLVKDTKKIPVAIHSMVFDKTGKAYLASNNNIFTISAGAFQTLAGSSTYRRGFADGVGTNALFSTIVSMAMDPQGNLLVVDRDSNCIRKITPDGTVTTPYHQNFFTTYLPGGAMVVDGQGVIYYASGSSDNTIIKMTPDGKQQVIAWWPFTNNPNNVSTPSDLVFDNNGDIIFTCGSNVYKLVNGTPVKIAGSTRYSGGYMDGLLNAALFNQGSGNDIVVDAAGNIYKAETNSAAVRKIILH
jgi:hypothetical protein